MAKIIGLPKLSPTMEEGTLVSWAKQEGEAVEIDDLLAEVETDKATMEFRSFDKGVLLKILAAEGATLAPDQPVAILGQAGEDIAALLEQAAAGASKAPDLKVEASEVDLDLAKTQIPPAKLGATPAAAQVVLSDGRVMASPAVRKLAREQNIDLRSVRGTGPRGRIILRDVQSLPAGSATASSATLATAAKLQPMVVPAAAAEDRDVPLTSMRRTIARRLSESKQQVPHFYLTIDIDAGPMWAARVQINKQLAESGEKISLNDLVVKASAIALRRVPEANASFLGKAIRYYGRVDISIAVAIPDGLVTPVVRAADSKSLLAVSREIKALAGKAKNKKLSPEEMSNGTFSISNLGMFGVETFSAVINPPEGAILAVGAVRNEAVVEGEALVPGRRMRMTLSCDHRVIDGAVGARFLAEVRTLLEKPLTMLL